MSPALAGEFFTTSATWEVLKDPIGEKKKKTCIFEDLQYYVVYILNLAYSYHSQPIRNITLLR